jgi:hypothetical protein
MVTGKVVIRYRYEPSGFSPVGSFSLSPTAETIESPVAHLTTRPGLRDDVVPEGCRRW